MLIEHVDAVIDLRRDRTLVHGDLPGTAPDILANLRETATAGGYDTDTRYHWATDLNVRIAQPGEKVDLLLMAGESAFDLRAQRTLRALVQLLQAAKMQLRVGSPRQHQQ